MAAAVIALQKRRSSIVVAEQLQTLVGDVLCPPEFRRRSGRMEKKMIATKSQPGTDGIEWVPRFAVLSDEKLAFVNDEGESSIVDFIPLTEVEAVSLQQVGTHNALPRTGSKINALPQEGSKPQPHSGAQGSFKVPSKDQGGTLQEYHIVIQTVADGFNSGRRYVHRVPPDDAEVQCSLSDGSTLAMLMQPSSSFCCPASDLDIRRCTIDIPRLFSRSRVGVITSQSWWPKRRYVLADNL